MIDFGVVGQDQGLYTLRDVVPLGKSSRAFLSFSY